MISNYVEGVAQLENPAQVDMFGAAPATREALWRKAVDSATHVDTGEQARAGDGGALWRRSGVATPVLHQRTCGSVR